ncbi:MAG: hypothetical protein KBG36_05680, partial [Candidatus Marinimicrobia bacterium]|nr:hypothetical protein [Candidatus Neomarinimicrobiota bacterium]
LIFSLGFGGRCGIPCLTELNRAGNLRPTSRHCGSDALTSWIKHSALLIFSLGFGGRCGIPCLTELNRAGNLR